MELAIVLGLSAAVFLLIVWFEIDSRRNAHRRQEFPVPSPQPGSLGTIPDATINKKAS